MSRITALQSLLFFLVLITPSIDAQGVTASLQPPKDQTLLLKLIGRGTQIYTCQTANGTPAWKLKAPEAKLFDERGKVVGHHFAGPTWEATDGSRIVGKMTASAPSPYATSIPWLLLTVVSHEKDGTFSKVQTIQRLNTKGGIAPAKPCTQNDETAVPYEATYYFFGSH